MSLFLFDFVTPFSTYIADIGHVCAHISHFTQLFSICAVLFMFAFPIWNMYEVVKENCEKISRIFTYAYIPFMILELYSL